MSESMIERVARVLNPWSFSDQIEENPRKAEQREIAMKNARAAIEAMREPTKAMESAGFDAYIDPCVPGRSKVTYVVFQAMIDAALEGKP